MVAKFIAHLLILFCCILLNITVMQHGWGVEPKSWWWIIGGGVVGQLSLVLASIVVRESK